MSRLGAPSARERLRQATDPAHERLHGLKAFAAIAAGTLTVDRYRRLLESLLRFHSTIAVGAAHCGWSGLSGALRRVTFLQHDLGFLGAIGPSVTTSWHPRSRCSALGALYAAQGSMFGGRVIAEQLDFLLDSGLNGRRFFIGSADDGQRWRELLAVLEIQCAAPAALEQAIEGALFAFGLFEQCVVAHDCTDRIPGSLAGTAVGVENSTNLVGAIPV